MIKDPKPLSIFELSTRMASLNRLDLSTAKYPTILQAMRNLSTGSSTLIEMVQPQELFFRVRVNPSTKPTSIADLGPPPAELVTGYQRCNPPGVPMFYTASRRVTALLECRVKPGDLVYLSQWIGYHRQPVNTSVEVNKWKDEHAEWTERDGVLYAYFDTLFTRRIHQTFNDDYKLTAAITEILTSGYDKKEFEIPDHERVGIRYASVVDIDRSYNTAFHAVAFPSFHFCHVAEISITSVSDKNVEGVLVSNALFADGGKLSWTDDLGQIPALRPQSRGVRLTYRDSQWCVDVHGDPMNSDEFKDFLNE